MEKRARMSRSCSWTDPSVTHVSHGTSSGQGNSRNMKWLVLGLDTGCLDDRALEMHGLLKPGERVNLIKRRALLYGPAINASSYSHVAMTFTRMMNTVCEYYKLYSPVPSTPMEAIAAASDFEGKT